MMRLPIQPSNRSGLAGILVSPSEERLREVPLTLIFNAGGEYRVGPSRLHVELARALCPRGFPTLRLDQSGFGDSVTYSGDNQAQIENLKIFLDALDAQYSVPGYICIGLCSGADNSLRLAAEDERIRGLILLDGPAYINRRYQMTRLAHRLSNPRRWRNFLMRFTKTQSTPEELGYWFRDMPTQKEAQTIFQHLVDRHVRILSIFSGGVEDYYNHSSQFLDNFSDVNFRDCLTHHYFARMTHTNRLVEDRRILFDTIARWLEQQESR